MSQGKNEAATARVDDTMRGHLVARLRAAYGKLDLPPLPNEHVELLLALRHKERERKRKDG